MDDEPTLRQIASLILEESGYSVLVAKDGREAVEIFRQNAPKIAAVLLDVTMPWPNGEAEGITLTVEAGITVPLLLLRAAGAGKRSCSGGGRGRGLRRWQRAEPRAARK